MSVRSPRTRTRVLAVLAAGALTATLGTSMAATSAPASTPPTPAPGLRLVAPADEVTGYRSGNEVYLEPSVWLASYGEGREFRATRPLVSDPVTMTQTIIRGKERTTSTVPKALVDGMRGFKDGLTVTVATAKNKVISTRTLTLCPGGGYERQRVDPTGPTGPVYPEWCGGSWFTKSTVFGLEQGWASTVADYSSFRTKQSNLVLTYRIADPVADFLQIPTAGRSVTQRVTVIDECEEEECLTAVARAEAVDTTSGAAATGGIAQSSTAKARPARSKAAPPADTLPDLASIPAWGISVSSERDEDLEGHGGAAGPRIDRLNFNANEWNAGPAPMVVEGFRRSGEPLMDAYQMFYRKGRVVSSKLTGTMEFHDAPQHHHWHFLDFAKYDLVKPDGTLVTTSGKQSWCLAPTDPVDLSIPTAVWRPSSTGLETSCGSESALWLREIMPVGWGDTYSQYQTQAFDLTGVPNGRYQIKVTVNPNGNLFERTTANNVSLRTVVLGGTPGARTVKVPRYLGVDTESDPFGEEGQRAHRH